MSSGGGGGGAWASSHGDPGLSRQLGSIQVAGATSDKRCQPTICCFQREMLLSCPWAHV